MRILYYLIPGLFLFAHACTMKKAQNDPSTEIIYILSEQEECMQAIEMNCLRYKTDPDSEEILVYDGKIEGFDYEDRHNYTLKIKKVPETAESGEKEKWSLVEVIEKTYDENAYMIPERISATYYNNARIKRDESTQFYPKIVPGSNLVLEMTHKNAYDRRVADAQVTETIRLELKPQGDDFTIHGAEEAVVAIYSKSCFCEYNGPAEMTDFTLTAHKSGDIYDISITIPAQNMDLLQMGQITKNVPYVREELNFTAEYKQGSVLQMMKEAYQSPASAYEMLNRVWELEQINGEALKDLPEIAEIPTIEIKTKDKMYYGNDGCNIIRGTLEVDENKYIKFNDGIATKKYCEGAIDDEFLTALQQVDSYQLLGDRLMLKKGNRTLLVFKQK